MATRRGLGAHLLSGLLLGACARVLSLSPAPTQQARFRLIDRTVEPHYYAAAPGTGVLSVYILEEF